MFVAEDIISKVADFLELPPEVVRQKNLMKVGDRLPYGMGDEHILSSEHTLPDIFEDCNKSFNIEERRKRILKYNSENKWKKRGVALVPTMFGVGFDTGCQV